MFATPQRIHFIGIGGIGMSGIAEILLTLGYTVSGSDLKRTAVTDRLEILGATVHEGHRAEYVAGADVVVTSSAVSAENPEVLEAKARKVPVILRGEMLAELMRLKYGIAVAGMHGKTTTTSIIAAVLAAGELDPTVVVGGRVEALGSNARFGRSRYLVAEADESDRSFLKLMPILAVVTNLDREHMDTYRDMDDVRDAFVEFMNRVPFYGAIVACADNAMLQEILPRVRRKVVTYGVDAQADCRVEMLPKTEDCHARFLLHVEGSALGPFDLHVPGMHNVLNASAAAAIGLQLQIPVEKIIEGVGSFRGVDRRFQQKGEVRGVAVVDDYGHHPTEVKATLRAARDCGYDKVHVLFQPHRYTRTRDMMAEFAEAFGHADTLQVLDIYAASEQPIAGITSAALVSAIAKSDDAPDHVEYAASFAEAAERLAKAAHHGDVVMTLGAGNVSQAAAVVMDALKV
jgi:UDP-N-acetylmuramate--alanine ligase